MNDYYKKRAPYYDRVYEYPERADDIAFLKSTLPPRFSNIDVLEVAAGTGYWTQFICRTARSVLATDIAQEPLDELASRNLPITVQTKIVDAYELASLERKFDGAFIGLLLSHIPQEKVELFFRSLHSVLHPGAKVVLIDNTKAQCQRLPITRTDEAGNSYQNRELDDGSIHEVVKNFPGKEDLTGYVKCAAVHSEYVELEHFWLFAYEYCGGHQFD